MLGVENENKNLMHRDFDTTYQIEKDKYLSNPDGGYERIPSVGSTARIVSCIGNRELTYKEIGECTGLDRRLPLFDKILNRIISEGFIRMLYPDSPRHPRQKYLLTVKGMGLYNSLNSKL